MPIYLAAMPARCNIALNLLRFVTILAGADSWRFGGS